MASERSGIDVVPQASWESLFTANAPANHRCRDCEGYADPTATHADCTFRGIRKAGYAGACGAQGREPNGRPRRKGAGIGFIPRGHEGSRGLKQGLEAVACHINPSMGPKPVRTRKDMSMNKHHDVPNVWTPEEDATLREFGHEGIAAVAERLGRSVSAVQNRASNLRVSLRKSAASGNEPVTAVTAVTAIPEPIQHRPVCVHMSGVVSCPFRELTGACRATFPFHGRPPGLDECVAAAFPLDQLLTVAVPKQVPVAATPTPTVLASVFTTPDAPEHAPQEKERTLPVTVIVTGADAVRDLILDLRNELEEVRIENLVMALRDVLGDGLDAFMSAHLFPAIEAAEAAGEARAER
jgi:hypothetical protein